MTHADEIKMRIDQILNTALSVVANGAGAMTEVNEALQQLEASKEKLIGSRVFALQALDYLTQMTDKTRALLAGTGNMEVMTSLASFERARQQVEDYANHLQFKIDDLDRFMLVVGTMRRDQELDPSGIAVRAGIEVLQNYRAIL